MKIKESAHSNTILFLNICPPLVGIISIVIQITLFRKESKPGELYFVLSVFDYCIYISLIPKRNKTPNSLSTINKFTSKTSYNIYRVTHKVIATSKIAVTLDKYSKKWYNMSQEDGKNGQNATQ